MLIKDHYKTLQLPPGATLQDIKKAYRTLAQQYHPDKNNDDPYAAVQFAAIKEAYETLSNPWKKDQYLQQRWYQQSTGNKATQEIITPALIVKQAVELDQRTAQLDVFRMSKEALFAEMNEVLSADAMEILKHFADTSVNSRLVHILIKPLALLSIADAGKFSEKLLVLAGEDSSTVLLIESTLDAIKHKHKQQQYAWLLVPVVLLLVYMLIRFTSGR